jgi:hypothetical protein
MIPAKPFNHQLGYILDKNRSSHIQLQLGFFRNLIYLFLAWLPEFLYFLIMHDRDQIQLHF